MTNIIVSLAQAKKKRSDHHQRECNTCGKEYVGRGKYYCSPKCQPRGKHKVGSKALITGKEHPLWKEDVGYGAVHIWLRNTYGKADSCKFCDSKDAKRYEWALIKGREYKRNIENFMQLCKSCHAKYDAKKGKESPRWKGGKNKCEICLKLLSGYKEQRCNKCSRLQNDKYNHAYDLYLSGMSLSDIGKEIGVSKSSVWSAFKKRGFKLRNQGQRIDLSDNNLL
jgi:predicted DNA-binding protein YlxM (UPF0122 family)